MRVHGLGKDVEVYNTGGWVVDTIESEPVHGGSVVFVDDACHCASLRLYNEPKAGRPVPPIRISAAESNPLSEKLSAALGPAASSLNAFTEAVSTGLKLRARALAKRAL